MFSTLLRTLQSWLFFRTNSGAGVSLLGVSVVMLPLIMTSVHAAPEAITYYVDCQNGNDASSGRSTGEAWRSMGRANNANLAPGDRLYFKRGCTWNSRLDARWHGNASSPIIIGAYGDGALPLIQNGLNQNVKITGSYLILEYLRVRSDAPSVDPNCNNQPIGWTKGFNFIEGSHHNTLRNSEASHLTAGVRIAANSNNNRIINNYIHDNHVMEVFRGGNPLNDLGAWGAIINGDDNEIAYNHFENNNALCTYGAFKHGNSVEIYQGNNNNIHHNRAIGDRVFSELGGSASNTADNNRFAFNLHVTGNALGRFVVVRGAGDPWGPTTRTKVFNNTVYITHPTGQGVVCGGGCGENILNLKNNILWAEEKAIHADAPFTESNNIYWRADGQPVVQFMGFPMHPSSKIADPRFVDPAGGNFRQRDGSPAFNGGAPAPLNWGYNSDLEGNAVPLHGTVDVGAYEKP